MKVILQVYVGRKSYSFNSLFKKLSFTKIHTEYKALIFEFGYSGAVVKLQIANTQQS
jgi:hypothetical protein